MTFLDSLDLCLIGLVISSQHLNILSQYLVTYLVPGVKNLPEGVDVVCHVGLDPPPAPGYYYERQSITNQTRLKMFNYDHTCTDVFN